MSRLLINPAPPTERVGRYPKHTFVCESQPFTLQPLMLARVLPGETLQNLFFESRVITDPVINPIIGWKKEYYFFYVRMSDLILEAAREMFVDPANVDIGATYGIAANSRWWYTAKGGINWLQRCTERVVDAYFRDDGEVMADYVTANGMPIVQIRENTFMDSLTDEDLMPEGAAIAGATDAGDLERLMLAFEQLRALGLAQMSYEDWLRSNGIAIPGKDENKPEMLGRWSEYQYPTNHIGTGGVDRGVPTSAVSWVFKNGNRDPKFFKEPGFVVGYSVARPKVYFGGLAGFAAAHAGRAWDWMPNYLRGMPETQLKHFAIDTGPLGDRTTNADGYFLDMRDELLFGDQFYNMAAFTTDPVNSAANHILPLPAGTNIKYKYPTEAMINGFFLSASDPGRRIRQDGYVSLSVKGHEVDYTNANLAEQ